MRLLLHHEINFLKMFILSIKIRKDIDAFKRVADEFSTNDLFSDIKVQPRSDFFTAPPFDNRRIMCTFFACKKSFCIKYIFGHVLFVQANFYGSIAEETSINAVVFAPSHIRQDRIAIVLTKS